MSTYCLLGRFGDIISVLPMLRHEALATGHNPRLVVAKNFASVLEGVSYVDPAVFNGDWMDLKGGMAYAKNLDPKTVSIHISGNRADLEEFTYIAPPHHSVTDSFEKEMWRLGGALPLWRDQLPLVFDRRSPEREEALLPECMKRKAERKKKVILIHLGGQTSPFPYKDLLWRYLELAFPNWERIDLSTIKAERIYDLLGILERADLLVACDSSNLHLSRGVPSLPVVALTKDTPRLWHGTAWRPQHAFYCRYGDFPARITELEGRIRELGESKAGVLDGKGLPAIFHVWSGYESDIQRQNGCEGMIDCCIPLGAIGRDSRTVFHEEKRFPFVRDVLRLACMKAQPEDVLCLTAAGAILEKDIASKVAAHLPCYAFRTITINGERVRHPFVDLFAFTKAWWQEHQEEMPKMIMGRDVYWGRVLLEVLKKNGAVELK